jgi:AmmeMemoRadiSam system protein A
MYRKGVFMGLSKDDEVLLLNFARKTIRTILDGGNPDKMDIDEAYLSGELMEKRGVFVTLHKEHELRGCIGYILPMLPLWQAVVENARNAAFRDSRFSPLRKDEFDQITIEISVLTVPSPIKNIAEFRVGIDGIILKKGFHQAVFLPQVAPEQGWDRETTLKYLSMKAGLPPDGWQSSATFETFQAEVFNEADLGSSI